MPIDCTAQGLATAARCFDNCIPAGAQSAVQTYLLAQISATVAGTSTDPNTLSRLATAPGSNFRTLDGNQLSVQTVILCNIASTAGATVTCTAKALATASTCLDGCFQGYQPAVKTYLLAQVANTISGTSTDPATLLSLASCFFCLGTDLEYLQTFLMCSISNGDIAP